MHSSSQHHAGIPLFLLPKYVGRRGPGTELVTMENGLSTSQPWLIEYYALASTNAKKQTRSGMMQSEMLHMLP